MLKTVAVIVACLLPTCAMAAAEEVTCVTEGRYTHCYDARSGALVSTTEKGEGDTSHTWTPDGRARTTQTA
jgi:hypothetical protein